MWTGWHGLLFFSVFGVLTVEYWAAIRNGQEHEMTRREDVSSRGKANRLPCKDQRRCRLYQWVALGSLNKHRPTLYNSVESQHVVICHFNLSPSSADTLDQLLCHPKKLEVAHMEHDFPKSTRFKNRAQEFESPSKNIHWQKLRT